MTYINDALSFYSELRARFMKLLTEEGILGEQVVINTKSSALNSQNLNEKSSSLKNISILAIGKAHS